MRAWLPRERRLTFGQVAELYDAARPSYPPALVDEVLAYARPTATGQVLEVGAGTGKATRLFAASGRPIVALEPSAEMAAIARRTCAPYPSVEVVASDFEQWPKPQGTFQLLISAQAWHWTDPSTRYVKARAVLRRGGALAVFWSVPDWGRCRLRDALGAAYRDAAPGFTATGPMHPSTTGGEIVSDWQSEIEAAAGFEDAQIRTYVWSCRYSAHEYVRLLRTHSDHIVLEPATRSRLLDRVATAIANHGGTLDLTYLTHLCLARAA